MHISIIIVLSLLLAPNYGNGKEHEALNNVGGKVAKLVVPEVPNNESDIILTENAEEIVRDKVKNKNQNILNDNEKKLTDETEDAQHKINEKDPVSPDNIDEKEEILKHNNESNITLRKKAEMIRNRINYSKNNLRNENETQLDDENDDSHIKNRFGKTSYSSNCNIICSNSGEINHCYSKCEKYFSNCDNCTCNDFCINNDSEIDCKEACIRVNLDNSFLRSSSYPITFYSEYYWMWRIYDYYFYFFRCADDLTCFCTEYCHYQKYDQCCYDYCKVLDFYYDTSEDFLDFYDSCEAEPKDPNNPFVCLDSGECNCLEACQYFSLYICCTKYCDNTQHSEVSSTSMLDYVFNECNPFLEYNAKDCYKKGICTCDNLCDKMFGWSYGCCKDYCTQSSSGSDYDALYDYVRECHTSYFVYPELCFENDQVSEDSKCSCKEVCRSLLLGNCCFKYCIEFRGNYTLNALKEFSNDCNANYYDEYSPSCTEPYQCNCEESCNYFHLDNTNCCSEYCRMIGNSNMYDLFEYYVSCAADYSESSIEHEITDYNSLNVTENISEDSFVNQVDSSEVIMQKIQDLNEHYMEEMFPILDKIINYHRNNTENFQNLLLFDKDIDGNATEGELPAVNVPLDTNLISSFIRKSITPTKKSIKSNQFSKDKLEHSKVSQRKFGGGDSLYELNPISSFDLTGILQSTYDISWFLEELLPILEANSDYNGGFWPAISEYINISMEYMGEFYHLYVVYNEKYAFPAIDFNSEIYRIYNSNSMFMNYMEEILCLYGDINTDYYYNNVYAYILTEEEVYRTVCTLIRTSTNENFLKSLSDDFYAYYSYKYYDSGDFFNKSFTVRDTAYHEDGLLDLYYSTSTNNFINGSELIEEAELYANSNNYTAILSLTSTYSGEDHIEVYNESSQYIEMKKILSPTGYDHLVYGGSGTTYAPIAKFYLFFSDDDHPLFGHEDFMTSLYNSRNELLKLFLNVYGTYPQAKLIKAELEYVISPGSNKEDIKRILTSSDFYYMLSLGSPYRMRKQKSQRKYETRTNSIKKRFSKQRGETSYNSDCNIICSNSAHKNLCYSKCQEYISSCDNCTCNDFCINNDSEIDCKETCIRVNFDKRRLQSSSYPITLYSEYIWNWHLYDYSFYFFRCEDDLTCFCTEYCYYQKYDQCCYDYCKVFDYLSDTSEDFMDFYDTCEADPNDPNNPFTCLDSGECNCYEACQFFSLGICCSKFCDDFKRSAGQFDTVSVGSMLDYVFKECNPLFEYDAIDCYLRGRCTCESICDLWFTWSIGCCKDYCTQNSGENNYDALYYYISDCYDNYYIDPGYCFENDLISENSECSCKSICRSLHLGNCCYKYCIEFRGNYDLNALKEFSNDCNAKYYDEYTPSCTEPYQCNCEESCNYFHLNNTNCCSEYCRMIGNSNMYDLFEYYVSCAAEYPELMIEIEPSNNISSNVPIDMIEVFPEESIDELYYYFYDYILTTILQPIDFNGPIYQEYLPGSSFMNFIEEEYCKMSFADDLDADNIRELLDTVEKDLVKYEDTTGICNLVLKSIHEDKSVIEFLISLYESDSIYNGNDEWLSSITFQHENNFLDFYYKYFVMGSFIQSEDLKPLLLSYSGSHKYTIVLNVTVSLPEIPFADYLLDKFNKDYYNIASDLTEKMRIFFAAFPTAKEVIFGGFGKGYATTAQFIVILTNYLMPMNFLQESYLYRNKMLSRFMEDVDAPHLTLIKPTLIYVLPPYFSKNDYDKIVGCIEKPGGLDMALYNYYDWYNIQNSEAGKCYEEIKPKLDSTKYSQMHTAYMVQDIIHGAISSLNSFMNEIENELNEEFFFREFKEGRPINDVIDRDHICDNVSTLPLDEMLVRLPDIKNEVEIRNYKTICSLNTYAKEEGKGIIEYLINLRKYLHDMNDNHSFDQNSIETVPTPLYYKRNLNLNLQNSKKININEQMLSRNSKSFDDNKKIINKYLKSKSNSIFRPFDILSRENETSKYINNIFGLHTSSNNMHQNSDEKRKMEKDTLSQHPLMMQHALNKASESLRHPKINTQEILNQNGIHRNYQNNKSKRLFKIVKVEESVLPEKDYKTKSSHATNKQKRKTQINNKNNMKLQNPLNSDKKKSFEMPRNIFASFTNRNYSSINTKGKRTMINSHINTGISSLNPLFIDLVLSPETITSVKNSLIHILYDADYDVISYPENLEDEIAYYISPDYYTVVYEIVALCKVDDASHCHDYLHYEIADMFYTYDEPDNKVRIVSGETQHSSTTYGKYYILAQTTEQDLASFIQMYKKNMEIKLNSTNYFDDVSIVDFSLKYIFPTGTSTDSAMINIDENGLFKYIEETSELKNNTELINKFIKKKYYKAALALGSELAQISAAISQTYQHISFPNEPSIYTDMYVDYSDEEESEIHIDSSEEEEMNAESEEDESEIHIDSSEEKEMIVDTSEEEESEMHTDSSEEEESEMYMNSSEEDESEDITEEEHQLNIEEEMSEYEEELLSLAADINKIASQVLNNIKDTLQDPDTVIDSYDPETPLIAMVEVEVHLMKTFIEEYNNLESLEYISLKAYIETDLMKTALSDPNLDGIVGVIVLGFSPGSVVVESEYIFEVTVAEFDSVKLVDGIIESVKNANESSLNIDGTKLTATMSGVSPDLLISESDDMAALLNATVILQEITAWEGPILNNTSLFEEINELVNNTSNFTIDYSTNQLEDDIDEDKYSGETGDENDDIEIDEQQHLVNENNKTSINTTKSPDTIQNSTETTQNSTETTQNSTETTQNSTETTQNSTQITQNSTETTQNLTEATQNSTETTQNSTETTQNSTQTELIPTNGTYILKAVVTFEATKINVGPSLHNLNENTRVELMIKQSLEDSYHGQLIRVDVNGFNHSQNEKSTLVDIEIYIQLSEILKEEDFKEELNLALESKNSPNLNLLGIVSGSIKLIKFDEDHDGDVDLLFNPDGDGSSGDIISPYISIIIFVILKGLV